TDRKQISRAIARRTLPPTREQLTEIGRTDDMIAVACAGREQISCACGGTVAPAGEESRDISARDGESAADNKLVAKSSKGINRVVHAARQRLPIGPGPLREVISRFTASGKEFAAGDQGSVIDRETSNIRGRSTHTA